MNLEITIEMARDVLPRLEKWIADLEQEITEKQSKLAELKEALDQIKTQLANNPPLTDES